MLYGEHTPLVVPTEELSHLVVAVVAPSFCFRTRGSTVGSCVPDATCVCAHERERAANKAGGVCEVGVGLV